MDLPEMGADGEFQVMAIEPCPPIEEGGGRLVTGEYRFSRGKSTSYGYRARTSRSG